VDALTLFGLFAVTAMLLFYAVEAAAVAVRRWRMKLNG
jgi:hypothetical protein